MGSSGLLLGPSRLLMGPSGHLLGPCGLPLDSYWDLVDTIGVKWNPNGS